MPQPNVPSKQYEGRDWSSQEDMWPEKQPEPQIVKGYDRA